MKPNDRLLRLIAFCIVALTLAALTGRLDVHQVNDSPSYLNYPFDSLSAALLSTRTVGYPVFLALISSTVGLAMIPVVQVLLHALASWFLSEELLARGMTLRPALAAALCVLLGCTAADHIHTISTDAPAASMGVVTAVLLMRAVRTTRKVDAVFCAVMATLTIFVRPAYLFLIPWLALASWLLASRKQACQNEGEFEQSEKWLGVKLSIAVSTVLLGWMTMRSVVVSDFSLAPFGHQNLSAILVQTVPPNVLRELPGEDGELGALIADRMETEQLALPSKRGDSLPTMTIETQWGEINYGIVWPLATELDIKTEQPGGIASEVRVHRRIGSLNRAILAASPTGYLRWLILATRRAAWGTAANLIMHPLFLILSVVGMFWILVKATRQPNLGPVYVPDGWAALSIVAISYAVFSIGFVILSSPPLGRFADAGAIFLPCLVASLFVASQSE